MRTLIYIDPGSQGGIAWRDYLGEIRVADLPVLTVERKSKTKSGKPRKTTRTDAGKLSGMLAMAVRLATHPPLIGYEAPSLKGTGGRHSLVAQGVNVGIVLGVAVATCPFALVEEFDSREVKAATGCEGGGDTKKAAVERACELFPGFAEQIKAPSTKSPRGYVAKDGRADALLGLKFMIDRESREG